MKLRAAPLTLSLLLLPSIASAHVAMTDPVPRSGDNGLNVGPCGGIPAVAPVAFTAGETITVSWAVGQAHGGSLTIDFAPAGDTGFRQYVLAADISDAEGMPTSMDVQLPDIDCEACTLRLVQINPDDDEYYSCADITLSGASGGSTSGGGDGTAGEGDSTAGPSDGTAGEGGSSGIPDPSTTTDDSASASASASLTDATASASASAGSAEGTGDSGSSSGTTEDDDDSGCSCTTDPGAGGLGGLLVFGLGLLARRRRA